MCAFFACVHRAWSLNLLKKKRFSCTMALVFREQFSGDTKIMRFEGHARPEYEFGVKNQVFLHNT